MPLDVEGLTRRLIEFRDARNWARFHNPKDLAIGLSVEAAELVEVFLWRPPEEADRARIEEELADVFAFVLLLAEKYGIDLERILRRKIELNESKYPVERARDRSDKYDRL